MSLKNIIIIILGLSVIVAKEYIYISDEFLVILSFVIIVSLFFINLSKILGVSLDEYSEKINTNAKDLVKLQQKVLLESKDYQLELINIQNRIKYLVAYILEETSELAEICETKYELVVESYLNNKIITILLLDIEYYEQVYLDIYLTEIDTIIKQSVLLDSETSLQQNIFFPFIENN
jgi:hypothetical protein